MSEKEPQRWGSFGDAAWILGIGSQAGLMLAGPVLGGLVAGYLIDRWLGTLPWITLVLTLIGIIVGPIMVYRMVTNAVQSRVNSKATTGIDHGTGTEE